MSDRSGTPAPVPLVTVEEVRAAAGRIAGVAVRTPLLPAPWAGGELHLKPENLQPIGAFKIRGAHNAISRLDERTRARGVVTYSSGNHAQAVAYSARHFGITAHIVMPVGTPAVKVAATRDLGGRVTLCPVGQREAVAAQLQRQSGAVLIPPFDHPDVIAGQGTVGLEIVADLPDVDTVLVPVSGGGLLAGVATAIKALRPQTTVLGVEPELAADAAQSLALGRRVQWPVAERDRTVADGLRSTLSELTFAHLQHRCDGVVTVTEDDIGGAVRLLALHGKLVAEPSGAVAVAAFCAGHGAGRTVAVVSGGNVEAAALRSMLD